MNAFETRLLKLAVAPYSSAGKFASHFAKGKLGGDPVFKEILMRGLIQSEDHILDIGCGQGLLSSWLLAAESMASRSDWPNHWSPAPLAVSVLGIELMPADIQRAEQALNQHQERFAFTQGDMCTTAFAKADVAVILDVLHYVPYAAQEDVLLRLKDALSPNGLLILRIGDADGGIGFKISNWVDAIVTLARGHSLSRLYCRPLKEWETILTNIGFVIDTKPMSKGTPFANVLLTARLIQPT